MKYIKVGNIVNTFGLKGELKVEPLTDFIEERFKKDQVLYILYERKYEPFTVFNARMHKGMVLVSFVDNLDINKVEKYKGCELFISRDDVHVLPVGQYYYFELEGCDVYQNNMKIGTVSAVDEGYQAVLRIAVDDKEVLVPYVPAFVKNVDIDAKRIDVSLIKGML